MKFQRLISSAGLALAVLGPGLLALPAQAQDGAVRPAAAPAVPDTSNHGTFECLLNARSQCWDVKDDHLTYGHEIWLFNSKHGNALGWSTTDEGVVTSNGPFTNKKLDAAYQGDKYWMFHKFDDLGIVGGSCLGESNGNVYTEKCYSSSTYWVVAGTKLVNVLRSDTLGASEVLKASGSADETLLKVGPQGNWYQWKINSCCGI